MKRFFSQKIVLFSTLLALLFAVTPGFAQRYPSLISSRNYFGIEAGVNYTWLPGSQHYFFTFYWPFSEDPTNPVVQPIGMINPGSGIGFQFGGTLDLAISDFLSLQFKLQYRQHSTSSTEDELDSTFDANGTNP